MSIAKHAALATAFLLLACGQPSEQQEERGAGGSQPEPMDISLTLVAVDSIGVELGDSNYVLGQPAGVSYSPSGDIWVLDMQQKSLGVYSAEGEYVRSIGREGSGPGEFLMPISFDFYPDGSFLVADAMGRRISFFDSTGEFSRNIEGFFPSAPFLVEAVDSSSFVGLKADFEQSDEGPLMGYTLALWEEEAEPVLKYFSELNPFDPSDIMGSMGEEIPLFATTPDGRVFCSPLSTERYVVWGYRPDGTELLEIEREFRRIRKTEEEIAEEKELVTQQMISGGAPESMAESYEPSPYRPATAGLGIDGEERLWVRLGTFINPTYHVYDLQGEHLFNAEVDYPGDAEGWQIYIGEGGFLAFDQNPEDYPRVYVLRAVEAD
ncbi:6-bladed beta-propeller [Candidatus Fermentibacteria bacterium]|nr:6-bladed beta-propeller [Candidatus Fermentibacteria bacterium]